MKSTTNNEGNMDLYTAYNQDGEILCYAGKIVEELDHDKDGNPHAWVVSTGSCRLVARSLKLLEVGDTFKHWQFGPVIVRKINRKTVKLNSYPDGTPAPDLVVPLW